MGTRVGDGVIQQIQASSWFYRFHVALIDLRVAADFQNSVSKHSDQTRTENVDRRHQVGLELGDSLFFGVKSCKDGPVDKGCPLGVLRPSCEATIGIGVSVEESQEGIGEIQPGECNVGGNNQRHQSVYLPRISAELS